MGGQDAFLETEALTGIGIRMVKKPARFTALEKGLLAALAVALILICVLISVIILFSYSTLQTEQKIENDLSKMLGERLEGSETIHATLNHDNSNSNSAAGDKFDSDMSEAEREKLRDYLSQEMARKTLEKERAFAERFPRDQYRSSAAANSRRLIHNLPRPQRLVSKDEIPLDPSEKVAEIIFSLDDDKDIAADPWELHNWILWVEKIFQTHTLEEQWAGFGRNDTVNTLRWSDYQVRVNEDISRET